MMNPVHAMALSLGTCGALATFTFMQFGGALSLWAAFVAWAAFFHSGGTPEAAKKTIASAIFGTILGGATMFLITGTTVGAVLGVPIWAAIVVFISAALAVLSSQIKILDTVPITMHALACVAAYVILNGAGGEKLLTPSLSENAMINVGISMAIGVGFGILTAKLAGAFTRTEPQAG